MRRPPSVRTHPGTGPSLPSLIPCESNVTRVVCTCVCCSERIYCLARRTVGMVTMCVLAHMYGCVSMCVSTSISVHLREREREFGI